VSVLNRCHFWLSAHAHFLRSQGTEFEAAAIAFRAGKLDALPVSDAERKLLAMIDTLTRHAYLIDDVMIEDLRDSGWTDAQIAEAVYIGSFFNMMVRIADAFHAFPPPVTDPDGVPAAVTR
jgi:alkylhydroperoxidase family enzyme